VQPCDPAIYVDLIRTPSMKRKMEMLIAGGRLTAEKKPRATPKNETPEGSLPPGVRCPRILAPTSGPPRHSERGQACLQVGPSLAAPTTPGHIELPSARALVTARTSLIRTTALAGNPRKPTSSLPHGPSSDRHQEPVTRLNPTSTVKFGLARMEGDPH
jgi:hypothetical protein